MPDWGTPVLPIRDPAKIFQARDGFQPMIGEQSLLCNFSMELVSVWFSST
jgi:hypothetical protein